MNGDLIELCMPQHSTIITLATVKQQRQKNLLRTIFVSLIGFSKSVYMFAIALKAHLANQQLNSTKKRAHSRSSKWSEPSSIQNILPRVIVLICTHTHTHTLVCVRVI